MKEKEKIAAVIKQIRENLEDGLITEEEAVSDIVLALLIPPCKASLLLWA